MADTSTPSKPTVRRARPVHSCLDCRNRKLKCDRARPCGQCTKAGRPNECHYDSTAGSMSNMNGEGEEPSSKRRRTEDGDISNAYGAGNWPMNAPASAQFGAYGTAGMGDASAQRGSMGAMSNTSGQVAAQQAYMGANPQQYPDSIDGSLRDVITAKPLDRVGVVEDLQARVARLEKMIRDDHVPREEDEAHQSKTGAAEVLVDLRHSHSSAMAPKRSIMHQFEDMTKFYRSNVTTAGGMDEIYRLRTLFPKTKQPVRKLVDSSQAMTGILEMIPPSGDCDRLLKIYLNTWDPIHQILDLSSFLNEYTKFGRRSTDDTRTAFAPALLLVTAIGSSLDDASQSQNPNFLNEAIAYVETWLADLTNKRQKDIEVLCVHTLLVLAMQCAAITPERIYRMSGSLVRSAMLMGLHYDPRVVPYKADEKHIQHRRRLWTSIVELDLQTSLQVGLPSAVRDTDLRTNATVSAEDPQHSTGTQAANTPSSTTIGQGDSHAPLQVALAQTLKTRLLTAALTLDVYPSHDFAAMRQRVNIALPAAPNSSLSHTIADTYIQRSILAITRAQIKGQNHRVVEGCLASTHASMTVLNHLSELDPTANAAMVSKRSWNLFVNLFSNEVYRSSLIICLVRKLATNFPPYTGGIGEYSPQTLIATPEACLHRLINNLDDIGNHIRDLLALTLALESVRPEAQKDEQTKMAAMKSGFDFLKQQLYNKVSSSAPASVNASAPTDYTAVGVETSPQGSSSGHTPLGNFDFQFLANSFNFDFDFGLNTGGMDPSFDMLAGQQAINFGGMGA